ncbi:transposon Ty3-I Gag-Pol polyprotein [Trichonephila clavipes]|nr:transposon Ty3-I Gag-Pol polyprotein [Trichonephila clavipes]
MSGENAEFVQTCKGCQLLKFEKIGDKPPLHLLSVLSFLLRLCQYRRGSESIQPPSGRDINTFFDWYSEYNSASDQGTNFKSALTQEFTKGLDLVLDSCPGLPASNGLVERWNKVLKDMIHHVIREDPLSWDRQLPFLLFAYREVLNTTTGVSPFSCFYGREARGPR